MFFLSIAIPIDNTKYSVECPGLVGGKKRTNERIIVLLNGEIMKR